MKFFQGRDVDFDMAYQKYADFLYRLALSHLNQKEDAEDALQEVFVKYFSTLQKFKDEEHERAWLVRVMINRCHDMQRHKKYRNHVSLEEIQETAAEEKDASSELFQIVSKLSEKYKSVIVLHYLEGYSIEETAFLLGISVSATKMRLSRSKLQLKKMLEEGKHV